MTIDMTQLLTILAILCGPGGLLVAVITRKKTNTVYTIQEAASKQVGRLEDEAKHWRDECLNMRDLITDLEGKIDAQDACQTTLKRQVEELEREKKGLLEEVGKLRKRVDDLEAENKRLKCIAEKVDV